MSFLEHLWFLKKRLIKIRNILFIIILALMTTVIYSCITVMNFSIDVKESMLNKDILYRRIITNMPQEEIDKLEHIEYVDSDKYRGTTGTETPIFDTDISLGYIQLQPLIEPVKIEIINGRTIENNGEAICPEKFYPHDFYESEKIYDSLFITGKDAVGKTFQLTSKNEDKLGEVNDFKIVGTFKNIAFEEINKCYISKDDFDNNVSKYSYGKSYEMDGEVTTEFFEYTASMLIVDKYDNLSDVVKIIEDKGFTADTATIDQQLINFIFFIPLLVSIIVLIISLNIIYSFIVKKIKYRNYELGILKTIGYQDKIIIKNEILENIIISFISFFISSLFLTIIYFIIIKNYLGEYTYYNYTIPIPILFIVLSSVILVVIVSLMTKQQLNRSFKSNITDLLENEVI